jgi:hypothetical protein
MFGTFIPASSISRSCCPGRRVRQARFGRRDAASKFCCRFAITGPQFGAFDRPDELAPRRALRLHLHQRLAADLGRCTLGECGCRKADSGENEENPHGHFPFASTPSESASVRFFLIRMFSLLALDRTATVVRSSWLPITRVATPRSTTDRRISSSAGRPWFTSEQPGFRHFPFAFSPSSTRPLTLTVEPSERLFEHLSEALAAPKSD